MKIFLSKLNNPAVINILWTLLGYIIKQGSQLISFILLVRTIGIEGFGAFTAVLGMAALTSPFVELGGYSLIVRDVHQRGMSFKAAIERSIEVSLSVFPIVFLIIIILKPIVFPAIAWKLVISVIVAELLGNRMIALFYGLNVARGQLKLNTIIESFAGLFRLGLVVLLRFINGDSTTWGELYLLQAALISSGIVAYLMKHLNIRPKIRTPRLTELKDSFHFALGSASQVAYNELDKVMLSRLSTLSDTGLFSSASRIVNLTTLPLFAVTSALYPRFFGSEGANPFAVAFKLLPFTIVYGVFAAIIIIALSPFAAIVLGHQFNNADQALQILAIISIFNAIHYPLADAMTGSGRQYFRTRLYIISLALNIILNLFLIPYLGWRGSAYATLITQVLLVLALFFYSYRQLRSAK